MNIVTSICVDEHENEQSEYPNTKYSTSSQRRIFYWNCVIVFFGTSIRCNPNAKHILYTNDKAPLFIHGTDIREFLTDLGVEIRLLPFRSFVPPDRISKVFKNAFYKLDVIEQLGNESGTHSLLLDSDCFWTKHDPELNAIVQSDKVLLYDVYPTNDPTVKTHGINRVEMGEVFKHVDPQYPQLHPIRFGGEIIGGSTANFQVIADLLRQEFDSIIDRFETPPQFSNGKQFFDGMEFFTSYVYNKMPLQWVDSKQFIRRIWTDLSSSSARPSDMQLAIWHMPNEKKQGVLPLVKKVLHTQSNFWTVPSSGFNEYLGKYLGVPERNSKTEKGLFLWYKAISASQYFISKYLKRFRKAH